MVKVGLVSKEKFDKKEKEKEKQDFVLK